MAPPQPSRQPTTAPSSSTARASSDASWSGSRIRGGRRPDVTTPRARPRRRRHQRQQCIRKRRAPERAVVPSGEFVIFDVVTLGGQYVAKETVRGEQISLVKARAEIQADRRLRRSCNSLHQL